MSNILCYSKGKLVMILSLTDLSEKPPFWGVDKIYLLYVYSEGIVMLGFIGKV